MQKRSSKAKPRDINQIAANIVAAVTGQGSVPQAVQTSGPEKNPAAVALGRLGGLKGGKARAKALTEAQRSDIARRAAKSRWNSTHEQKRSPRRKQDR